MLVPHEKFGGHLSSRTHGQIGARGHHQLPQRELAGALELPHEDRIEARVACRYRQW
jgi:hypothetical protein